MVPFRLQYALGRRDRFAVEVTSHLPAVAAALGFTTGTVYLACVATPWFLALLALPAFTTRRLLVFLLELVLVPARPVDVVVEADRMGVLIAEDRVWLYLDGVIQVYRSAGSRTWTLLHLNGSVLLIPPSAITAEQVAFLQGFAMKGWRQRQRVRAAD